MAPVALNLAKYQDAVGSLACVVCADGDDAVEWATAVWKLRPGQVCAMPRRGPKRLFFSPEIERSATTDWGRFDVVHQHGLWTFLSRATNLWRSKFKRPTVIAPHGALSPWALRKSRWKKQLVGLLYQQRNLREAACLHAVGCYEEAEFRELGLQNPVAFIPNGVPDSWILSKGDGRRFRKQFSLPPDKRILLFLSRITPKKGLPLLFNAISEILPTFRDWLLIIAGADEFSHRAELEALAHDLKIGRYIRFVGPVFDQVKRDAFAAADIAVLPSHSEGLPVFILEALAVGLPVLATSGAAFPELTTARCGWICSANTISLAESLYQALNANSDELEVFGKNGKELIMANYRWTLAADKTLQLYLWLLGHRERPAFVHLPGS